MSYRKRTLEQRVSKLERILKLERDREYYNSDDAKSIPTLVARSLDSDDPGNCLQLKISFFSIVLQYCWLYPILHISIPEAH